MNTKLEKIFKSFEEVNLESQLESQKVELALTDDIKQAIILIERFIDENKTIKQQITEITAKIVTLQREADAKYKANEVWYKRNNTTVDKVESLLQTTENQAKIIGINTNEINGYNSLKNLIKEYDSVYQDIPRLQKYLKDVSGIKG